MKFFTTTFLLLFSIACFGQKVWEKTSKSTNDQVITTQLPNSYQLYDIDIVETKKILKNAPERFKTLLNETSTIFTIPNKEGELQSFKILEAPMLAPELAARFPMIKTYIGQGIEDPTAVLNLSIGTDGLHAMIRAAGKSPLFIDPYTKDRNKYISYSKADQPKQTEFVCGVTGEGLTTQPTVISTEKNITDGQLRQYDLVIATTIEYSAFHLANQSIPSGATTAEKKAAVLSAITTTINRVKGIYETELSVTFVLNANEDSVIFIDSDNFTNSDADFLIEESQTEIDNAIGNANYDVGHTFSTGGGGLAAGGGICTISDKAKAITGSNSPIGDSYDVDFVAHEIGHHFGANHTYNGTGAGSCNTSEPGVTAEPGSGTTIMAYAGICNELNVQSNSDAYFHILSLKEINDRLTNTGDFTNTSFWLQCSINTSTGNNEPVTNAGSDYTIPQGTAFLLTGSSVDADGDAVTYCWDQLDLEQPNIYPLVSTTSTGPLYRSLEPIASPSRYMPKFETVYNGSLQSTWEVTPTVARSLNFNLTTRDNKASGGQSTSDDMLVTVASVGPFGVSSQSTTEVWTDGESQAITWNVAGTTANNINVANVEITLVNSAGTVLSTLAASTPNDGSHSVTVPSLVANDVRVKVTAIGNIFYALNGAIIAVNTTLGYCNTLCPSSGSTSNADGTTLVNFGTINNPSTGAPDYSDFTAISTDLVRGQSYDLTINVDTDGSFQEATKVWIDWNRDCDFDDAGEEYDLGSVIGVDDGPAAGSPLSILVPADAELGETRMRVTSAYSGGGFNPTSCATNFLGEVEDYSLNVLETALPVEFTHFEAKVKDARAIQLDWHTVTEINNAGFEIERSLDGNVFRAIGWINGNETSLTKNVYQYLDTEVNINQRYYYRLKQVDYDGTFDYSMVQTAIISNKDVNISVYPNPASDRVTVNMNEELLEKNSVIFFQLLNTIGQVLSVSSIEDVQTNISLQNLPSGVYFYRVINGEEVVKSDKLLVR